MFLHVGYKNYVEVNKILAITGPDAAPLRRLKQNAAGVNKLIECTAGRNVNSLIHLQDGYIVTSASTPETLIERMRVKTNENSTSFDSCRTDNKRD